MTQAKYSRFVPAHEIVYGGMDYSCSHSFTLTVDRSQLHAATLFFLMEMPRYRLNRKLLAPELVWVFWARDKYLDSSGNRTTTPQLSGQ